MRELSVFLLPGPLSGGVAVVIDVLRATTTLTHALAAGAAPVIPCVEVEQARQLAAELGGALRGGEREGKLIPGFDLDNSPLKYTPETVGGKPLVFTTTNGTRALQMSSQAQAVVLGSFVNIQAVLDYLRQSSGPMHLVCAGTNGEVTAEDSLFAGAVCAGLRSAGVEFRANDAARMVEDFFRCHHNSRDTFYQALCQSRGGRNLFKLGYEADIRRAGEWNRFRILPGWSPDSNTLQTVFETTAASFWTPFSE